MDIIGFFFDTFLIDPLTNLFVFFTAITGNAGIAVILLTIFIRLITLPAEHEADEDDADDGGAVAAPAGRPEALQRPQAALRRADEALQGVRRQPAGLPLQLPDPDADPVCPLPDLQHAIGESPEAVIQLSHRLYDIDFIRSAMPLPAHFLWLNLGRPDPFVIPVLVGATTYVLQKMTMMPAATEQQQAQNSMMNLMMPFIFVIITLNLPSGLGLYYVLSNLIGMVMQYLYIGRGPLTGAASWA